MAKVLVVDDARFSRVMVVKILQSAGYQVVEAENGQEAFLAVEQHDPDCLVTDLLMPVLGGQGLLRRLRESGSTLPVIVVTADIQTSSRAQCEALGVSGFLTKPVQKDALLETLAQAVAEPGRALT